MFSIRHAARVTPPHRIFTCHLKPLLQDFAIVGHNPRVSVFKLVSWLFSDDLRSGSVADKCNIQDPRTRIWWQTDHGGNDDFLQLQSNSQTLTLHHNTAKQHNDLKSKILWTLDCPLFSDKSLTNTRIKPQPLTDAEDLPFTVHGWTFRNAALCRCQNI